MLVTFYFCISEIQFINVFVCRISMSNIWFVIILIMSTKSAEGRYFINQSLLVIEIFWISKYFGIFRRTRSGFPSSFSFPRCSRLRSVFSLAISLTLFRRTLSSFISLLEIDVARSLSVADFGSSSALSSCSCSTSMQEILSLADSCECFPDCCFTIPSQATSLTGQLGPSGLQWYMLKKGWTK